MKLLPTTMLACSLLFVGVSATLADEDPPRGARQHEERIEQDDAPLALADLLRPAQTVVRPLMKAVSQFSGGASSGVASMCCVIECRNEVDRCMDGCDEDDDDCFRNCHLDFVVCKNACLGREWP